MADDLNTALILLADRYGIAADKVDEILQANFDWIGGTLDDPDSFNAEGGTTGARGYYPVVNGSGDTVYIPCWKRIQATAAGGVDLSDLEDLLAASVSTVDSLRAQAVTARDEAVAAGTTAADDALSVVQPVIEALTATASSAASSATASEIAAAVSAAAAQSLTAVAGVFTLGTISHAFVDENQNVYAGLKAQGRDFFMSNGMFRVETDGKFSFITGSDVAKTTTPVIQDHGDGIASFGVASMKVRFNTNTNKTTIDGLDLAVDSTAFTQVGSIKLGTFTGIGARIIDKNGSVTAQFGDVSAFGGWVFDSPNSKLYAPDGQQIYPIAPGAIDGSILTQVGSIKLGTFTGIGTRILDNQDSVIAQFGDVSAFGGWVFDSPNSKLYAPDGGQVYPATGGGGGVIIEPFSAEYIRIISQEAYNESNRLRDRRANPLKSRGIWSDYNLIDIYGQSNSLGTSSHPAKLLSTTILGRTTGGLMLGNSVHGASESGTWTQCGTLELKPMIGTVRGSSSVPGSLLTPSEQYAVAPEINTIGETFMETAIATMDWLRLRDLGATSSSTKFVGYAAGTGGRTLAELSKGNAANLYPRRTQAAALAATAAGPSLRDLATLFSQGEADVALTPAATWTTQFRQMRADRHTDITVGILGEPSSTPMVPVFISQTCAHGVGSTSSPYEKGMQIPNAQLDLSQSDDGVFCVASYRGTKKGIHWDVNTTQWTGQRIGYVMYQHLVKGEVPFAFAPHKIQVHGNQMLVTFLVPTPPIRFDFVYSPFDTANDGVTDIHDVADMISVMNTNKGFYPYDDAGDLTVTSVEIKEGNSVLITCNRAFGVGPKLQYGRRATPLGAGNVCDSTDFQFFSHEYDVAKGYGPWESVPAYANQPFPIGFDLCLFSRNATAV